MKNKIAVIGDKDSVSAFVAVGVDVYDAITAEQADKLVKQLSQENYAVIFVAENLAELIADTLAKAKAQAYPAVIPIPTNGKSSGFGMQGIKNDVEKALGVDILFNKKDDE